MTQPTKSTPSAIVAAALVSGLIAAAAALSAYVAYRQGTTVSIGADPVGSESQPSRYLPLAYALIAAVATFVAVGSTRGWRLAQGLGAVLGICLAGVGVYLMSGGLIATLLGLDKIGAVTALVGGGLVGLLVVPRSSRDWFAYEH